MGRGAGVGLERQQLLTVDGREIGDISCLLGGCGGRGTPVVCRGREGGAAIACKERRRG